MSKIIRWMRKVGKSGKAPSETPLAEVPPIEPLPIEPLPIEPLPIEPFPPAIHEMEWKDQCKGPKEKRPVARFLKPPPELHIVVQAAQGASDCHEITKLLKRETGEDMIYDATLIDWTPVFYCDRYRYDMHLTSPSDRVWLIEPVLNDSTHFSLILTYDASSTESWDEMVASYEDLRRRNNNQIIPFPVIVAAMGEGPVSPEEAEKFARDRSCLFFQYSPVTGRGLCDAVAAIVGDAHRIRIRYATDPDGFQAELKRMREVVRAMFVLRPVGWIPQFRCHVTTGTADGHT